MLSVDEEKAGMIRYHFVFADRRECSKPVGEKWKGQTQRRQRRTREKAVADKQPFLHSSKPLGIKITTIEGNILGDMSPVKHPDISGVRVKLFG